MIANYLKATVHRLRGHPHGGLRIPISAFRTDEKRRIHLYINMYTCLPVYTTGSVYTLEYVMNIRVKQTVAKTFISSAEDGYVELRAPSSVQALAYAAIAVPHRRDSCLIVSRGHPEVSAGKTHVCTVSANEHNV